MPEVIEHETNQPMRDAHGRLLPGHSLKGGGRPKGMTNSDKIRLLLEPEREKLIGELLKAAMEPNPENPSAKVRALELALSRLAPPPKQEAERVVVPGFRDAVTLAEKAEAVIAAAACGDISAEAATKLLQVLDIYNRTITASDHETRLRALEEGKTTSQEPEDDGSSLL